MMSNNYLDRDFSNGIMHRLERVLALKIAAKDVISFRAFNQIEKTHDWRESNAVFHYV